MRRAVARRLTRSVLHAMVRLVPVLSIALHGSGALAAAPPPGSPPALPFEAIRTLLEAEAASLPAYVLDVLLVSGVADKATCVRPLFLPAAAPSFDTSDASADFAAGFAGSSAQRLVRRPAWADRDGNGRLYGALRVAERRDPLTLRFDARPLDGEVEIRAGLGTLLGEPPAPQKTRVGETVYATLWSKKNPAGCFVLAVTPLDARAASAVRDAWAPTAPRLPAAGQTGPRQVKNGPWSRTAGDGYADVLATVELDGTVSFARLLRTGANARFAEAALRGAMGTTYEPPQENGIPCRMIAHTAVSAVTEVTVTTVAPPGTFMP